MSTIHQNILSERYPRSIIMRRVLGEDAACLLTKNAAPASANTVFIGISYHISETGAPDFICLASLTHAFIIPVSSGMRSSSKNFATILRSGAIIGHDISSSAAAETCLVGFGMARIAIQVGQATGLRVKGVDLSSLETNSWETWSPSKFITERVDPKADKFEVARLWMGYQDSAERDIILQAWLAACAAENCGLAVLTAGKFDTQFLNQFEQVCLSLLVAQADLLEQKKPKEVPNDFSHGGMNKHGKYEIHNSRYKTRIRRGEQCQVILTDTKGREYVGSARQIKGKRTTITLQDQRHPGEGLKHVKVVGRPDLTNSEKAQNEFILLVMAGTKSLRASPFIRMLWFPNWKPIHVDPIIVGFQYTNAIVDKIQLNESQRAAVHAMVGPLPLVIVHGPPGTGKTTTIAAASRIWDLCDLPVWIVAHSNVAVKNIAETLHKKLVNFKLIVSKEFYEEWHEHLYQGIAARLIRSDELPKQKTDIERLIGDSRIILCTLSMISNPALDENGTFDIVPFNRLVIDEASQINAFEFMHIFGRFHYLEKVCFFGDPNQLPPYGHEDVSGMKTIFEFDHLKQAGVDQFLNTQYRMPNPIATFISMFVYNGRLLSKHDIHSSDCLAFVNASSTGEERAGFSSRNQGEIETVVHLVRNYYRRTNFCVITPYDAQRAAIQKRLEDENLPWEAVYNVDSFQGNEADYVIVSVVRSSHSGFLRSHNRMNVLLTRCRRGLVIVSSQSFLGARGNGSDTLLGKLVAYWQLKYPRQGWIDWKSVADGSVDLPGIASPKSHSLKARPTIYSVNFLPSSPQKIIPLSSRQRGPQPGQKNTYSDVASDFPPLVSTQPLLSGSWHTSVFHPLSRYRGQSHTPDAPARAGMPPSQALRSTRNANTSYQKTPPPSVTNIQHSARLKASNQQSDVQNLGRKATSTTTRQRKKSDSLEARDTKQQPRAKSPARPESTIIRGVTVYSRPNIQNLVFAKRK